MNNKIKGYKIDFSNNCVYMNYKFATASAEYGSEEYQIVQEIKKDFPKMRFVTRSGRNQKTCNANKRLTYSNMERYIKVQNNAEELLIAFEIAKEESKCEKSPYAYVRLWFIKQFPDYKQSKLWKESENVITIPNTPVDVAS